MSADDRRRALRRGADLERHVAEALGGERRTVAWDLFTVRDDVFLPDYPNLRIDAKSRATFAHHRLFEAVRAKYCAPADTPILATRARGGEALAVMPLDFLGDLLSAVRRLREVAST